MSLIVRTELDFFFQIRWKSKNKKYLSFIEFGKIIILEIGIKKFFTQKVGDFVNFADCEAMFWNVFYGFCIGRIQFQLYGKVIIIGKSQS